MNVETLPRYTRIADQKRLKFILNNISSRLKPGAKILDIGCGNGVISIHLGSRGYAVLGIDVSDKTIKTATQQNTLSNVSFVQKSAEELSNEGQTFDAIICSEVLEHLNNPGQLLEKIGKLLSKDGILIATVPNGNGPRELFVTRPMLHLEKKNNYATRFVKGVKTTFGYSGKTTQSNADNLDHVQFFSYSRFNLLLQQHNFKMIKFGKANFIDDVFPFSFFANRLIWLQKIDCWLVDYLPRWTTGGFFTVSIKQND